MTPSTLHVGRVIGECAPCGESGYLVRLDDGRVGCNACGAGYTGADADRLPAADRRVRPIDADPSVVECACGAVAPVERVERLGVETGIAHEQGCQYGPH